MIYILLSEISNFILIVGIKRSLIDMQNKLLTQCLIVLVGHLKKDFRGHTCTLCNVCISPFRRLKYKIELK